MKKDVLKYKGYWARVQYSEEDECFWGEVEGLKNTSITFEGNTVKELKKDFKDAIDYHLQVCKELGEEPEKPCKGSLNVRLGVDLHNRARMMASAQNISINELIKNALTSYLKTN